MKITSLATCWRIALSNGKLLRFTDADEDIIIDNEKYICGSYFTPNKIFSSNELAQENFVISGIIDEKIIKHADLLAGDLIDGYLEIFLVDIFDPHKKKNILKTGWLGEIKCNKNHFTAEICSLGNKTNNVIGRCYSSSCRAEFGEAVAGKPMLSQVMSL